MISPVNGFACKPDRSMAFGPHGLYQLSNRVFVGLYWNEGVGSHRQGITVPLGSENVYRFSNWLFSPDRLEFLRDLGFDFLIRQFPDSLRFRTHSCELQDREVLVNLLENPPLVFGRTAVNWHNVSIFVEPCIRPPLLVPSHEYFQVLSHLEAINSFSLPEWKWRLKLDHS